MYRFILIGAASVLVAAVSYTHVHPPPAVAGARVPVGPGIYLEEAMAGPALRSDIGNRGERRRLAPRIVGGTPTDISQLPWQVAVAYRPGVAPGDAFDRQICGGSLVTPTLVITAAHCVVHRRLGFLPPDQFSVLSGRTQLSSGEGRESLLTTYYLFVDAQGQPLYDPRNHAWDVVVLELAEDALGSPITIAGPDEGELSSPGRSGYVSGWGRISESGRYSDGLLSAEIVILSDRACSFSFGAGFDATTSLCAGTALGTRDSCYGDSGGPLVVPVAEGGFRLVGDTSFGRRCGSHHPGGYGRLAAEPMRSALRNAALSVSGQDIVGSGGQAPTVLSPTQARENAWIYVEEDCFGWRACRQYRASPCVGLVEGYRCKVSEYARNRRDGRFRCTRNVFVSAASGVIERLGLGRWRCRNGW
jgi:Trypsin